MSDTVTTWDNGRMVGNSWELMTAQYADRDAASRFRALFDHAPAARAIVDLDGSIVTANDAFGDLLGYAPQDLVGRMMLDLVAPANQGTAAAETEALLAGIYDHAPGSLGHCRHRDGHLVPTRAYTSLIRRPDGSPQAFMSTLMSLEDEKRAWTDSQHARAAELSAIQRSRIVSLTANAANAADGLDDVISTVLDTVVTGLGWHAGCLLEWTDAGLKAHTAHDHITWMHTPQLATPVESPRTLYVDGRRIVAVPVPTEEPLALAFDSSAHADPVTGAASTTPRNCVSTPVPFDLLTLIAGQCARVREREITQRLLRANENRFRVVFDDSPFPMAISDDAFRYVAVNDATCTMLGRSRDSLVGTPVADLIYPDDLPLARPAAKQALVGPDRTHTLEIRLLDANGEPISVLNTLTWMTGADGTRMLLGQMADLTSQRKTESALRYQAETDGLTGLTNRTGLLRVLAEDRVAQGETTGIRTVIALGLDGFSLINQIHGHDVGDEILAAAADRLHRSIHPIDTVARVGGDQFVVVCRCGGHTNSASLATDLANTLQTALSTPIDTTAGALPITASIGIAQPATAADGPFELFQRADTAMAQAKSLGKDRQVAYDAHLHRQAKEHQQTVLLLRGALDEHRFVVHYQPVVDTRTGQIVGTEALTRLKNADGRLIFPDRFIPEAEASGLIVPMGTWVLHEACRHTAELRRSTGRELQVSVNVAARQAIRADLTDSVNRALTDSKLPADALTLELTESTLLEADDATLRQFQAFRDRGIHIALDDFGTGYSSLTYLRRLPVTHVKVDKSFVLGMTTDTDDAAIVRAVIGLARDVGLQWVAEGVETRDHWEALQPFGPGLAQGYLFAKPLPGEELEQVIRDGVMPT